MSFKRKDLEIVYSLRWKNGPKRDDKKQMSIVAVCDIPATTLNFQVFKSYLLKNSGTAEDDVSVSYIMDNGKEYPIQSQIDFQVALYAFRNKARAGEVIHLLLERMSDQQMHKNLRHSNDAETQFDNMEPNSMVSSCCNFEMAPEWFIAGLAQLKKEIKEEVTASVSSIVSSALAEVKSPPFVAPPAHHSVCPHRIRSKPDKRLRKITPHMAENVSDAKNLIKTLKLENKLDKLERKASKYREKRLALQHGQKSSDNNPKSSDSEAGHSSSRSRSRDKEEKRKLEEQKQLLKLKGDEEPKMDARPVNIQTSIPHMVGGEVYLHQWDVQNTGQDQWTSLTQLHYTWGSKKLVPVEKVIQVPFLKPGEIGTVSVRLQVPSQSGKYECYWQFMHKGRRFGHGLGVHVIVDSFDLKGHNSVLEKTSPLDMDYNNYRRSSEEREKLLRSSGSETPRKSPEIGISAEAIASFYRSLPKDNADLGGSHIGHLGSNELELLRKVEEELDSDCSYDSEPKWSKTEEKGDFVVVPVPQCFLLDTPDSSDSSNQAKKDETPSKKDDNFDNNNNTDGASSASNSGSIKLRDEELDNIVVITVPKDEQVKEGFIYVHVDGQKVLIPKNILKSEVVSAAQELEKSPSAANSIGVIVGSNESLNKSPTSSTTSTIKKDETNRDGNTLDSVLPKTLEEPIAPHQVHSAEGVAVDLSSTACRDNLEYPADDRSNYFEANNYMSHCSAAGSCYSDVNSQSERQNRLFIFPQDVPGYEVVYPVLDVNNSIYPNLTTETFVPPSQQEPVAPTTAESATYNIPQQSPNPFVEPVPNFQQTPPEQRRAPVAEPPTMPTGTGHPCADPLQPVYEESPAAPEPVPDVSQVHILPESLLNGAVNAASSAINTARSVINMIKPQAPGRWVNGHWVSTNPQTPREANLQALAEMGFWNRDLNATLLARFKDDLNRVVAELVQ